MSTIANLLLAMDPAIKPYSEGVESVNRAERGRQLNQTGLIELAKQKQLQAAEAAMIEQIKNDPEVRRRLFGDGGGPVLGSLMQPQGAPAPGPITQSPLGGGPGQQIPAYPDASRFAGVSPQGGGPLPAGVGMPTVTPPQSTIAALGPAGQPQMQAPRNPVLEMAQRDPRAAMMLQQQMQGQQDRQFKLEEQRLDWTSKKMGHFGQVLQGVNSPESYANAVQEIGRVDAQAAARLPRTYNKEALIPYIKQATTVKENADLQIKMMHEQTEQGKLQVQLAQAGYAGLGTDVTSILRGLTDEQVQQFGGRTSAKAIAYATEEEKKRKLGQAGEAERLKFELEEKQRATLPLQDARKEDAGLFVSKGTGQTIPGTTPYGQVKQLQDEKDPEKGVIKLANLDEKKQLTTLKQLEPVLQQYADLVQYAYGTDEKTGKKGPLADYTRSPGDVITAMYGQLEQTDPTFQAKRRALQGQLQSVVRGLGARGDLNEAELKAATEMIANMDASMGLGLGLGVGAGGGGLMFGAKPTISIPDSPATGVALANELIGTVNRRIGSILQHEGYAKTPTIKLQTGPPASTTTGTAPSTTPPAGTTPAQATPAPAVTPPAKPKGRQPGEIPVLGGPGMPEQYLPAPGKQSQAQRPGASGVRVAGGPKFMELRDVQEAMRQTGRSRTEVEKAARARGYTVFGSRLPLPEETAIG